MQNIPTGGIRKAKPVETDINSIVAPDALKDYVLNMDLDYLEELHDDQKEFPLSTKSIIIPNEWLSSLVHSFIDEVGGCYAGLIKKARGSIGQAAKSDRRSSLSNSIATTTSTQARLPLTFRNISYKIFFNHLNEHSLNFSSYTPNPATRLETDDISGHLGVQPLPYLDLDDTSEFLEGQPL
ncbi:hypothetical protein CHS0354_005580 [Potamilus streckersoni]|uniref:Uncharacterized protein n=1 Tax=Potamilus streckersoni TaxID=2493646 RepID=A0AAE0RNQ6_9BIVA|nr:hypothetical protein CHS0354_005580 [Potamilus streckersoni]